MAYEVLYSFVGNHDPLTLPAEDEDPGPVLSLLRSRSFDHLVLLVTGPQYSERAVVIQQYAAGRSRPSSSADFSRRSGPADGASSPGSADATGHRGTPHRTPTCSFVQLPLESVVDYEEIYSRLMEVIPNAEEKLPAGVRSDLRRFVLLDPGTPQMQTVWFLMVRSGVFDATLLQGIPARFGGGVYRAREVNPHPRAERSAGPAPHPADAHTRAAPQRSTAAHQPATGPEIRDALKPLGTPEHARSAPPTTDAWTVQSPTIIGRSPATEAMRTRMEKVAPYAETVLVTSESGTGKELVARHIHNLSPRRDRAFVPVNCAALGSATIESELFGHRKGAFTGAAADRNGVFRAAAGGTLFLDEIAELPLPTQAKLLRAIEYGEVTPVGADTPLHVDVRIVAATNRDLAQMVEAGAFREDLFERIRRLEVPVPPLRERGDDVLELAEWFVSQWSTRHNREHHLTREALDRIKRYSWPRNVRQLQNVINQACTFADAREIGASQVVALITAGGESTAEPSVQPNPAGSPSPEPAPVPDRTPAFPVDLPAILTETERGWYRAALSTAHGNRADAARLLGIKPPAFRKALKERFPELADEA
ncbi:MAG: sigma 54-interacting transcriptional regulator [Alkalispirochaeta sp.]